MAKIKPIDPFVKLSEAIDGIPDDVVRHLSFVLAPNVSGETITGGKPSTDEDGFPILGKNVNYASFHDLQKECWTKFIRNPQINAYIRDYMGNLTGYGFEISSANPDINDVIELVSEDPRNNLPINMPKYVARSEIEGELFLPLTLHRDGFVEIDFADPSNLNGGGYQNSGIIYHPKKPTMPLMYLFNVTSDFGTNETHAYPSINLAYYPELYQKIANHQSLKNANVKMPKRVFGKPFKSLGGFSTFVVSWNKGYLTPRNVSHIRTTITWLNHYESLKEYEIDHKKASGAYLWVVTFEDLKAFRTWAALSDSEKAATGLMAAKTPGGTLFVPPGIKLECTNPKLTNISGSDTDIMRMAVSGLNRPEDMITGVSSGTTFAGIKATRGPQADRIKDELSYFKRFLIFEFWRAIFYLHSTATTFPSTFRVQEVIGFDKGEEKKPILRWVKKPAHKLLYVSFPTSEIHDTEATARSLLGVKHGSVVDTLGIAKETVAEKMGINNYRRQRLKAAEEEMSLPPTLSTADAESTQEKTEAEPKVKKKDKKTDDDE